MSLRIGIYSVVPLRRFSGTPHYLVRSLEHMAGVEVVRFPTSVHRPSREDRFRSRLGRMLTGRRYLPDMDPRRCRKMSRELDEHVEREGVDAVLLFGAEACAFSTTQTPLFCYADAIFGSTIDFYPGLERAKLRRRSLREGVEMQQQALDRLTRLFLTSGWAWERGLAAFDYRDTAGKCETVWIGANYPNEIIEFLPPPPDGPLRFTWIGVNWRRKRGEFAVDVVAELRRLGHDARLEVIGPVAPRRRFDWLTTHGRLMADVPDELARLRSIYAQSQALLLPTTADLTPVVICEAYSWGRAVITAPVGGIPEQVTDGETGLLISHDSPTAWAERIDRAVQSGSLSAMGPCSRQEYERRLNYPTVCSKIVRTMMGKSEARNPKSETNSKYE